MNKHHIKTLIERQIGVDGLMETRIPGIKLFRATDPVPCVPAVYEPCVIAIVSGSKETILDGAHYVYDNSQYLCCPTSMPVKAGTPAASVDDPLFGVFIALDQRILTEMAIDMEAAGLQAASQVGGTSRGIKLARWDDRFSDALSRVLDLTQDEAGAAILGASRLRELYFAILMGDAGSFVRQRFGVGNVISRMIAQLSSSLNAPISVDEMATRAGMSRAVFHRKFKEATTMSPVQFVKSMRLNSAAMKIAGGQSVNEAALDVGYISPSQFSREFRRMYGQSPRQWGDAHRLPLGVA